MGRRFIDNYDVILLDMGKTFMFDCDRFDDLDALQRTYEDVGGTRLAEGRAGRIVAEAFCWGMKLYRSGDHRERFPSTLEMIQRVPEAAGLSAEEMDLLVKVMAAHEVGTIPAVYVEVLHALARTHLLGLVSNVFSLSDVYRKAFDQAGIAELFDVLVWSSDVGPIKPCSRIFRHALRAFDVSYDRVVHVGDSFSADVVGARNTGIAAAWINSGDVAPPAGVTCQPDLVISDLRELLER